MRPFALPTSVSILAILAAGVAQAAPPVEYVKVADTYGSGFYYIPGGDLKGPYVGANFSGFSAGVMTFDASLGYNFPALTSSNIYFGIEGTLGVQLPSNTFEAWGYLKAGPELHENLWLYGLAGFGTIDGYPVYGVGGGVEYGLTSQVSLYADALVRGSLGSSFSEFGLRAGVHYYFDYSSDDDGEGPGFDPYDADGSSYDGFYVGGSITGYSAGVMTFDTRVGYNWDMDALSLPVKLGIEGSFGVQQPSSNFETWGYGKVGVPINDTSWAYAKGGFGSIGGSGAYSVGAGIEFAVAKNLSIVAEGNFRGAISSPISEFGATAGINYYFDWGGGDMRMPRFAEMFDGQHELYAGISKGFVPNASAFVPSVEFGWNCYPAGDIYLGGNIRFGVQLPAGDAEIWGGGRVGYRFMDNLDGYLSAELGNIGGTAVNGFGVGLNYHLNDQWRIGGEVGARGSLGTLSEGVLKLGGYYKFDWGNYDLGPSQN